MIQPSMASSHYGVRLASIILNCHVLAWHALFKGPASGGFGSISFKAELILSSFGSLVKISLDQYSTIRSRPFLESLRIPHSKPQLGTRGAPNVGMAKMQLPILSSAKLTQFGACLLVESKHKHGRTKIRQSSQYLPGPSIASLH